MKSKTIALAGVALFLLAQCAIAQTRIESAYSDLAPAKCRTVESDKETGSSTQSCPGVAGYRLLVHDDDDRQSITVVSPGGQQTPLNFWDVITLNFSSLGPKAEWRVTRRNRRLVPIGLIVRVNASEDSEHPERHTSYLAVAKITADKICVTRKIPPGSKANEEARRAADSSAGAECLKEIGTKTF